MAVGVYTPPSTKIIHWTGVDFVARPSSFPPVHLVQYDQKLPVVAVNLYNNGKKYSIPSNATANVLVDKGDGTFVSNPVLGCNNDRSILYFEVTYQMVYYSGVIKPVIELIVSGTDIGSSSAITVIVDRNPVQEDAKESVNEYKSAEQLLYQALAAKEEIEGIVDQSKKDSANLVIYVDQTKDDMDSLVSQTRNDMNSVVNQAKNDMDSLISEADRSKNAAAQSASDASLSEQNAKDYLKMIEAMSVIDSSAVLDSNGEEITDSDGLNVIGMYRFATFEELRDIIYQIFVLRDRNHVLEQRVEKLERSV